MGADASIFSQLRQQAVQPGPMDQYLQVMSAKQLMGQNETQDLQRQKLTRDMGREEAFQNFAADPENQKLSIADWMKKAQGIDYARGTAAGKSLLEADVAKANLEKTQTETIGAKAKQGRDLIASMTPDNYADVVAQGAALKQQWAATAPAQFDPQWQRQHVMDADKFITQNTPKIEMVDLGGKKISVDVNPATNPAIKTMGFDKAMTPGEIETNKVALARLAIERERLGLERDKANRDRNQVVTDANGNIMVVNKDTATGAAATGPDGQPLKGKQAMTESQGKAAGMALRASEANKIINTLEDAGETNRGIIKQGVEHVPVIGGGLAMGVNTLPGALGGPSGNQQKVEQARRDFVNAVLRVESGASINASEFQNAERQYFPMPGDTDEVISQKRANRETAINALKIQMGNADIGKGAPSAKPPAAAAPAAAPPMPKKGAQVDGYTYIGGDPANPRSWKKQ